MFRWISRADEEAARLLDLERQLEVAALQEMLDYRGSELTRIKGELARATRTNDSLASAHAELAVTISELRLEASAALAARDAMDAAMSEKAIDKLVGRRVMLHTKGLNSLEGVLVGVYPDAVVLRHAFHIDPIEGSRQILEGDQVVPRPFEFVQELELAGAEDS